MRFILHAEGVESNDPNDPGGRTRFGLSQRAHPHLDIATLTVTDALKVYRNEYWRANHLDLLPSVIAVAVCDACVQHGARPAIRMLQHGLKVEMDGILGPVTAAAAKAADSQEVVRCLCARRGVYYANLNSFKHFGYGWFRRIFALADYCRGLAP
jgi:lysozyme family protein